MDPNDELCGSSFCRDEKVEAMDLLEEWWFFQNLFKTRKAGMPRCNSDPCPSSGLPSQDVLQKMKMKMKLKDSNGETNCSSISKEREAEEGDYQKGSRLMRQPSDPTVLGEASEAHCREMKQVKKSECGGTGRRSKLLRTPSLPPSIGREEKFRVSDPRNGRSSKQLSSPTHTDILPPKQTSKSYSIPRSRGARNTEVESSMSTEGIREMRRRYLKQRTMRKSLSDLEFEEVQGFKDLGFSFEKEAINPSVANIIPGLQEKNREEREKEKAVRRPYLSEAWLVQSCAPPPPPIPTCTSNISPEDMKAHIKFWARAVASNVRQER